MAKNKPSLLFRAKHKISKEYIKPLCIRNNTKIFCIGFNKTGTTSLKVAMKDLGYVVGHQQTAEKMSVQWVKRDFSRLIKYCHSAEFFQDVPFSFPYTFIAMDQAFPHSKFILTIRDSPEQWYTSLTRFHAKLWGENRRIPTREDLQNAEYIIKGAPWKLNRWKYTTPEDNPYEKGELMKRYKRHIVHVKDYFRHRPKDLLVLNVAEKGAYQKLCSFLGRKPKRTEFPWKNKTANT